MFEFVPGATFPFSRVAGDSNYLFREIVDIRECNEVTFDFPFTSVLPWLENGFLNVDNG